MKEKILIVDDEEIITKSLKEYLESRDFTVFVADKGDFAIELIEKEKPDLIILDLLLKGKLTGLDVLKEIKKILDKPKVIVLTGSTATEKEIKDLGVSYYLNKPITISKLFSIINEALGGNWLKRSINFLDKIIYN